MPNLGVLLFIPYRAMETRVLADLTAAGYDDVSLPQARLFQRIGSEGTRLTSLAEQAQVTKQAAGFLVDQLERRGYVERVPDPADGRARLIRIAPRGAQAVEVSRRSVEAVEAEWVEHLGPERVAALGEILTDLRAITDPWREA